MKSWRERETLAPGHNFPVLSPNSHSQRRRAFKLQAYLYKRSTPVIKILVHVPSFKRRLDIIIARYIRYNPLELTKGGGRGSSSPLTLCGYAHRSGSLSCGPELKRGGRMNFASAFILPSSLFFFPLLLLQFLA